MNLDPASARGMPAAAGAQAGIIDCQSHLFCPEIIALLEQGAAACPELVEGSAGSGACPELVEGPVVFTQDGTRILRMGDWLRKIPEHFLDVNAKLAAMDRHGIAMTALSINDPGPEWFGADGPAVARLANDFIAGIVRRHPSRFIGLCVLPLPDVPAALQELDRCVTHLGMKGILLYTNLAGRFPDEPEFRPLFARAEQLNLPLLLHPAKPLSIDAVKGYEMISALGNMFEDTVALTRIIMSGILDQYPKLKVVCPHLGGALPFLIGRLDHQVTALKRGPATLTRLPSEYLKMIWFDVVSPLPLAMRFALEFFGPEKLLFASDHPWVEPDVILNALQSLKLPPAELNAILSGNATRLFAGA